MILQMKRKRRKNGAYAQILLSTIMPVPPLMV
jgi:hypothetical protein